MTVNEAAEQLRYNLAGEIDADSNLTLLDAALAHERSAAVAAFVWERLESSPGFNEEMAQALADVKAGRVTAWSEVKARLDEEGYVAPDLPERSAGAAPPCDHIVNGAGGLTECGRTFPCEYHDRRSSGAAPLDVVVLTATLWGMKWNPDASAMARKIAAEYARLTEGTDR